MLIKAYGLGVQPATLIASHDVAGGGSPDPSEYINYYNYDALGSVTSRTEYVVDYAGQNPIVQIPDLKPGNHNPSPVRIM